MPKLTTTRQMRSDDDIDFFEYTSEDLYNKNEDIVFNSPAHSAYYGYRLSSFSSLQKIPLLNCSEYGLANNIDFPAIRVLIDGNADIGLNLRGEKTDSERRKTNLKLQNKVFKDPVFIKQIDLIFENHFSNIDATALMLEKEISVLVDSRRKLLYGEL